MFSCLPQIRDQRSKDFFPIIMPEKTLEEGPLIPLAGHLPQRKMFVSIEDYSAVKEYT